MLTNNYSIMSTTYEDMATNIAAMHNITILEATEVIKQLSFKEYVALSEATAANIPSPSGNAQIGGSSASTQVIKPVGASTPAGSQQASQQTSYKPGDSINVANANGNMDKLQIVKQDTTTGEVTAINKQTGKEEVHKLQDLLANDGEEQPDITANNAAPVQIENPFSRTLGAAKSLMQSHSYEDKELNRILELAGLAEDASCGATTAGSIATVAKPLGKLHKRKQAEESGTGTIYGKIDPGAATGELSRRLADKGMNTASRKNNGKKST